MRTGAGVTRGCPTPSLPSPTWNVNTMAEGPAAIFSKDVTLSLEARVEEGMAQTEKRVLYNIMEPPHRPRLPASSISDTQKWM